MYISGEFLLSFSVCFLFYFFIFLLNQLLLLAKQILAKGIPLESVLLLLIYSFPIFLTLAVPFAVLTAALMAYGRFSSENEIMAMRSVGFSKFVILQPVFVWGIILTVLSFMANDILLPSGNRAFQRLWVELAITHPGLELTEYSARKLRNSILITGAIDQSGIHPLIIIERENSGNRNTLMAEIATTEMLKDATKAPGFMLYDVFTLMPEKKNRQEWSWSNAASMSYRLLTSDSNLAVPQEGPATMKVSDVYETVQEKKQRFDERIKTHSYETAIAAWAFAMNYSDAPAVNSTARQSVESELKRLRGELDSLRSKPPEDNSLLVWTLEYYQKFAVPFSCIPFVILAFPLGLKARRSGRAVGFFIGLLLATFYWSLLIVGRSLGLRAEASPFTVMVLPDIILLIIGIILFLRRSRI